jgi:hypothetical protein
METPNAESAEYEIDDEIKDLDTTVAINLTTSSDTPQAVEKAPTGYLLTPEQTPVPDNASPPPLTTPTDIVSSLTLALPLTSSPPVSADFDARNILPDGSTRKRKPRQQIYAAQLANTSELSPFYSAFASGLSMAPLAERGQHRDTLPFEPKS